MNKSFLVVDTSKTRTMNEDVLLLKKISLSEADLSVRTFFGPNLNILNENLKDFSVNSAETETERESLIDKKEINDNKKNSEIIEKDNTVKENLNSGVVVSPELIASPEEEITASAFPEKPLKEELKEAPAEVKETALSPEINENFLEIEHLETKEDLLIKKNELIQEKEKRIVSANESAKKITEVEKEVDELKNKAEQLLIEKRDISKKIKSLDSSIEKETDHKKIKEFQENRWLLEESRRKKEEERWPIDEKIINFLNNQKNLTDIQGRDESIIKKIDEKLVALELKLEKATKKETEKEKEKKEEERLAEEERKRKEEWEKKKAEEERKRKEEWEKKKAEEEKEKRKALSESLKKEIEEKEKKFKVVESYIREKSSTPETDINKAKEDESFFDYIFKKANN